MTTTWAATRCSGCCSCYPRLIASTVKSVAYTAIASLERLLSPAPLELSEARNFLLLQYPLALGTAIHATPLIPALHAAIPNARIVAAASGFALDVLQNNPGLEKLIATPSPIHDLPAAVHALRKAKPFGGAPFVTLSTVGNERSRVTLAAMLAGCSVRAGFTLITELSNAPMRFDPAESQIDNNLHIVKALGHEAALLQNLQNDPALLEPQVFPSPEDFATAQALLAEQGIETSRPIAILVTQTSPTQRKSWRAERFLAVAESLHSRDGMQIVFVGTAAESELIVALRQSLSFPTANVAGRTTLPQLSALFSLADIAITLDTGPMHLARAMRLPMVIIAPAWSPAVEWLPLGNPRARILKNGDLPTAPPDYIIDEVSVAEVLASADELITLYPPRAFRQRL